jgi:hypothetical protein
VSHKRQSEDSQSAKADDRRSPTVSSPAATGGPDIEDFTEIQLPGGRFRGFIAGAHTMSHGWSPSMA